MSALKSVRNQFLGINPHLHSRLQVDGNWDNFHVNHISDLTRYLQRDLRDIGYLAQAEQSLQIRRRDDKPRTPESDVTIYDRERRDFAEQTLSGGLALSVPELLALTEDDLATYRAIGIYQKTDDDSRGDAVAWLELLSPANKPNGRHFTSYHDKRTALLQAGLVFIELDYLHHQPPTIVAPEYPTAGDSSAFRILIIDPRPDWLNGDGRVYPIHVDQALPTLTIPLNVGDNISFDFDAPYQGTFEGLFFGDEIDYAQLPVAWNHFSELDKARILSRLLTLRETGLSDTSSAVIEMLPLEEAQRRWEKHPDAD